MSIDQKKEHQKKRLAKQLRTNLMRRKAQAKQRVVDSIDSNAIDDHMQQDGAMHDVKE